ncbi:hypothetical protein LTR36_010524 [Oleoguttula mirabilis]|uniref:Uncharacterized protein n=1 Tax=Oleoguttula mirabilis TaxID=1507867 RepID=A0AAV9J3S6_9PEZI|nr:hypothetical protein LTR36_010524 [Oleoguttula mirabilis]
MKDGDHADGTLDLEWVRLVRAWALGFHLQATDFQDAVIDAILQKIHTAPRGVPPMLHRVVFSNTKPGSQLRRLIVDIAAWRWDTEFLKAQRSDGAWRGSDTWADFSMDLALLFNESKKTGLSGHKSYQIQQPESTARFDRRALKAVSLPWVGMRLYPTRISHPYTRWSDRLLVRWQNCEARPRTISLGVAAVFSLQPADIDA